MRKFSARWMKGLCARLGAAFVAACVWLMALDAAWAETFSVQADVTAPGAMGMDVECDDNSQSTSWTAPETGYVTITSSLHDEAISIGSGSARGTWSFNGVRRPLFDAGVVAVTRGQSYTLSVDVSVCANRLGGRASGSAEGNFSASALRPPPNDRVGGATPLDDLDSVSQSLDEATTETSDPPESGARTLWYSVRPVTPTLLSITRELELGLVVFETDDRGNRTDTTLPHSQDGGGARLYRLRAGEKYLLMAVGEGGPVSFSISQRPLAAPPNDNVAQAQRLTGTSGTFQAANSNATRQSVDSSGLGPSSVWYRFVAPTAGRLTIRVQRATFDAQIGIYSPRSDLLNSFDLVASAVHLRPALSQATVLVEQPGQEFFIAITGAAAFEGNALVSYTLAPLRAASNDLFARAVTISGASGRVATSTVDAGREASEPRHSFRESYMRDALGGSVWFNWIAPASGTVRFATLNAQAPTTISIYRGAGVSSLIQPTPLSRDTRANNVEVSNSVSQGNLYRVAVAAIEYDRGASAVLSWSFAPFNDITPQVFFNLAGTARSFNGGATAERGERTHGGSPARHSVWYSWRAPQSGTFSVATLGALFPTVLAAYEGSKQGRSLASARAAAPARNSSISFGVVAGRTYFIALDSSLPNATGACTLSYSFARAASSSATAAELSQRGS